MMPIPDPASACVVGDGGDVWDCEGFESAKGCEAVIVRVVVERGDASWYSA